ncbi:MAG: hypothetical protein SFV54_14795 [Bryobacteraceae bacterium]|nr:hypothetical protein [Bryobacteraceae bacterium]
MRSRRCFLSLALLLLIGCAGVLYMASLGPLQAPSVLVYVGLGLQLAGLVVVPLPPKFMGIRSRVTGLMVALAGAVAAAAGLLWPVTTNYRAGNSQMDAFLPSYDFHEFHEVRVHADSARAMRAVREVTFAEIGPMRTLGRIRNAAMRTRTADQPMPAKPIVALISASATAFFPLHDGTSEYIFGMAGQPWKNGAPPTRLTPEEFATWMPPDNIKVAANVRVESLGDGWSRVTTETRVLATDEQARRTMARYWRLIYPGSAMIRRSMLEAIKQRAEQRR